MKHKHSSNKPCPGVGHVTHDFLKVLTVSVC